MENIDSSADHIARLKQAMGEARGRAGNSDGSVHVEVGADGVLHGIHLSGRGTDLGAHELISMLIDLHGKAAVDATLVMQELLVADERGGARSGQHESPTRIREPHTSQVRGELNSTASADPPKRSSAPNDPKPAGMTDISEARAQRKKPGSSRARLSAFDPVTFAPLPRAIRASTPESSPCPPDLLSSAHISDSPHPCAGDRPGGVDQPPASDLTPIPENPPAEHDFTPTDRFTTWGEPADGLGFATEYWPLYDDLFLSDDWWGFPTSD
ncbi:hypothetical protein ACFVJ5_01485 [Nocardia sp. NPDC127606]|uniref:hypothetical protein n=1 Tax=Nocardia sp. NPDC127606 TaxID=3345406 RepID=UPI003627A10E